MKAAFKIVKEFLPALEKSGPVRPELRVVQEIAIKEADRPDRAPNFPPLRSWSGAAVVCWIVAVLVGAAGLFGWFGGHSVFATFGSHLIPIAHSEATLFIVLGFSLAFYVCGITRKLAKPSVAIVLVLTAVFSILKITEFLGGAQFGIENIFQLHAGQFQLVLTGRMSPVTASLFALLSLSLFLLLVVADQRHRAIRWAAALVCVALTITLTVLLGYCYGTPLLYGGKVIPMSLPTAVGFLFLVAGTVFAIGPLHVPVQPFLGDAPRARLLRAFLPMTLVGVVANGVVYHVLPDSLKSNTAILSALTAITILFVTSLLVSRIAHVLGHRMELAEAKSSEVKAHLQEQVQLLDLAPDAIFNMNLDGRIHFWNMSSTRLFGWTTEDAVNKDAFGLIFRSGGVTREELIRSVTEHGEREIECQEQTKDGHPITLATHFTLVRGEAGKPQTILAVCRDVTTKRALEARKLRSERLQSIGTLASGIAHDVNNALLPIIFSAEMLKLNPQDDKRSNFLDQIMRNAERVRGIMKQILLFVGGAESGKQTINLSRLLKDTEQILRHTLPKTLEIKVTHQKDLLPILGDETQVSQVFMNLAINARDAMGEKGRLAIDANNVMVDPIQAAQFAQAKPGAHVHIIVSDTGAGIPAHVLDKIFDPFFTTKEVGKGTGLGLSTVLGIIESHGGFLTVHSQINQGTRFEIWLPAAEVAELRELNVTAEPARGHGETVLVIDDEEDIRHIATEALEMNGYKVLTAADGSEAVALFAQYREQIAAVVCDMMMPVMDGVSTIKAIKRIEPTTPVIAMSGLIEERSTSAKIAGATAMLQKPFTANMLLNSVGQLLPDRNGSADKPA